MFTCYEKNKMVNIMRRLTKRCPLSFFLCAVLLLGSAPSLQAAVFYVNGSCANNGDGTTAGCAASVGGAGAHNRIQAAIDNPFVVGGSVVKVVPYDYAVQGKATVYYENLIVNKEITLEADTSTLPGSGPPMAFWTIIDGDQNDDGVGDNGNSTVAWTGGVGGTLRNLRVEGGYSGASGGIGAGVLVAGEDTDVLLDNLMIKSNDNGIVVRYGAVPTIKGCRVYANDKSGIVVRDGAAPVIGGGDCNGNTAICNDPKANKIYNNSLRMSAAQCFAGAGFSDCERERPEGCAAVAVLDASTADIWGNLIYANRFAGVVALGQSTPSIKSNFIRGNGLVGVGILSAGQGIEISGNWLVKNQRGIGIQSAGDPCYRITVKDNDILSSKYDAISACNSYVKIGGAVGDGNRVAYNNRHGVFLALDSDGEVSYNNIYNNYTSGVTLFGSSGVVEKNLIADNGCGEAVNNACVPKTPHEYGQVKVEGGGAREVKINNNLIVGGNYSGTGFEGVGILVQESPVFPARPAVFQEIKSNIIYRVGVGIKLLDNWGYGTVAAYRPGSVDRNLVMQWDNIQDTDGVLDGYLLGGTNLPGENTYYYGQETGSYGSGPAKYIFSDPDHESTAVYPDFTMDSNSEVYNVSGLGLPAGFVYADANKHIDYTFQTSLSALVPSADTTAPVIERAIPADGLSGAPCNQTIVVKLKDTGVGIKTSSLRFDLNGGGTAADCVDCAVTISGDSSYLTATLTPGSILSSNTPYTLTIHASDTLLNSTDTTLNFTTVGACEPADNVAPDLNYLVPANGAANVAVDSAVEFELTDNSSGVDPASVTLAIKDSQISTWTDVTSLLEITPLSNGGLAPDYLVYYNPTLQYGSTKNLKLHAEDYDKNAYDSVSSFITTNDTVPPKDISKLKAVVKGNRRVKLTWIPSENMDCDIAGYPYTLYIDAGNGYVAVPDLSALSRYKSTYTVTSLGDGTYSFKVTVKDTTGNESAGTEVKNISVVSTTEFEDDFEGFYDEFNSGLTDWTIVGGANWAVSGAALQGSGSDGEIVLKNVQRDANLVRSDYNYTAKVKINSAGTGAAAWLLVRKAPGSLAGTSGYAVMIGVGTENNIGVYELSGGGKQLLADTINANVTNGAWYTVELEVEGNFIKVIVLDDSAQQIAQLTVTDTDNSFGEGEIGFWQPGANGEISYDNVKVDYNRKSGGVYCYSATQNNWIHSTAGGGAYPDTLYASGGSGESELLIDPVKLEENFIFKATFNIASGKAGILARKYISTAPGTSGYLLEIEPAGAAVNNIKFYKLSDTADTLLSSASDSTVVSNQDHRVWLVGRGDSYQVWLGTSDSSICSASSTGASPPALDIALGAGDNIYSSNTIAGLDVVPTSKVTYDDIIITADLECVSKKITLAATDYNTIQFAIDNASFGDTIVFPSGIGTYDLGVDTLKMKKGVSLKAQGPCTSACVCSEGDKVVITGASTLIMAADAASIEGFKLLGHQSSNIGIRIDGVSPTIKNNEIMDCYDGIRVSSGSGIASPLIRNNCIHDNGRNGIANSFDSTAIIRDNKIYQNIKYGIGNQNASSPFIEGNEIYENTEAGIGNRDISSATISHSNLIFSNSQYGIAVQDHATPNIQNNYIRNNLAKGIAAKGDAALTVYGNNIYKNGQHGVACKENVQVNIINNLIYSNKDQGVGFSQYTGTALVDDNHIYDNKGFETYGIGVTDTSSGNVTISNNTIQGNEYGGIGFINNPDMQSIMVVDNVVDQNGSSTGGLDVSFAGHCGIQMDNTANVTLEHNTITSNANDGIAVRNASPFVGFNFVPPGYRRDGVWNATYLTKANLIRSNKRSGIVIDGNTVPAQGSHHTPMIQGNLIEGNVGYGIAVQNQYANPTIYVNDVKSNGAYGLVLRLAASATVDNNHFMYGDDVRVKEGAQLKMINGNYLTSRVYADGVGTNVLIRGHNYLSGINCHTCGAVGGNAVWRIEEYNDIVGGIHLKDNAQLYMSGHNKVYNATKGIEKQSGADVYIWDGNEFYSNTTHIRSHSGDLVVIGYEIENFDAADPLNEEKWGKSSPNIFRNMSGWGTVGAGLEIKAESVTLINNVFRDNGITGDIYPVLRYGCCGGGTLTIKENKFYNNGAGFKISGKGNIVLDIENNEFYDHITNVIGFDAYGDGVGYISGSIRGNKIYNNSDGVAIGCNPCLLSGDLLIAGNQIYGNKQGIGIKNNTQGNGYKIKIGSGSVDDWNYIYNNLSVGVSGRESSVPVDINGNDIYGNGTNPPSDFNYGNGVMFKDYTGEVVVKNNLIERNLDNGVQFKSTISAATINVTVSSNTVRYNGSVNDEGGIRFQERVKASVTGNKIYKNYDDGIAMRGTSANPVDITIADNEIYENGWDWKQGNWNTLIDPRGVGVDDYSIVTIERNRIYNNGNGNSHQMSAGIGFNIDAGANVPMVRNNFIYGHKHFGMNMSRLSAGLNIYGNTIADNDYGIYRGLNDTPFVQPTIKNTIIWGNTTASIGSDNGNLIPTIANSDVEGDATTLDLDPDFADTGNKNYRIKFGSPCQDAGTQLAAGDLDNDFDKETRPIGIGLDIGADEIPASSELSSAVANDSSGEGVGLQSGDQVVLTFSTGTQGLTINASNIDTVLDLSGTASWLDQNTAVGTVSWDTRKYLNDTLTVNLTAGAGVKVGDTITLSGDIIDHQSLPIITAAPVPISGSFDGISGLAAHWRFDENGADPAVGDGYDFYDSLTADNHGYLGSAAESSDTSDPTWVSGKLKSALSFDGAGDFATVAPKANVCGISNEVSIAFWIYHPNALGSAIQKYVRLPDDKVVIEYDGSGLHFSLKMDDGAVNDLRPVYTIPRDIVNESFNSGQLGDAVDLEFSVVQNSETVTGFGGSPVYVRGTDYTVDYTRGAITCLPGGSMVSATEYEIDYTVSWLYLVATYDGNTQALYVNGKLIGSEPVSGTASKKLTTQCNSGDNITISSNTANESLNGLLDEVSIYERALSPAEVQSLQDNEPPYLTNQTPVDGTIKVPQNEVISFHIRDDGVGVNRSTIAVRVKGQIVTAPALELVGTKGDYTLTYTNSALFSSGETVQVRVEAKDMAAFPNKLDTTYSFTINNVPNTPVNNTPANDVSNIDWKPVLLASAFSDLDAADTHQSSQWQVALQNTFVASAVVHDSGITTSDLESHTVNNLLLPGTTHHWRVRYQDSIGDWSDYSASTSFSTKTNHKPYQPVNNVPASLTNLIVLTSSVFNDQDIPLGDGHQSSQWQLTVRAGDYAAPIIDSGITSSALTSYTCPPLTANTTYYWHVRHQDLNGLWSDYSAQTSFTTGADPGGDYVDHYHIDFDPAAASTAADFRIVFSHHTAAHNPCAGAAQVSLVPYLENNTLATGTLKIVNGYDNDGLPVLVEPLVDASEVTSTTIRLRYDKAERIKIKLLDGHGKEIFTDVIDVKAGDRIINGDFETGDMSGWYVAAGNGAILTGSYLSCQNGSYVGVGSSKTWGSGTLRSEVFTLKSDEISFCYGHGGVSVWSGSYIALYKAADNSLIQRQYDDSRGNTAYWDVSGYKEQGVYLGIVDTSPGNTWDWMLADNFKYDTTKLDHYHINFDPQIASAEADFRIRFIPHTINESVCTGKTVMFEAYKADGVNQAGGRLFIVDGYDGNGHPIEADPQEVDATSDQQVAVLLRYELETPGQPEQIRIKLVDSSITTTSMTDVITVGDGKQITNGDFESGDMSGWFVESGNGAILYGAVLSCQSGPYIGVGSSTTKGSGVLRSEVFTVKEDEIAFCYGHDGKSTCSGCNVALYRASDDGLISKQYDDSSANTAYWGVSNYRNKGVYLKIDDVTPGNTWDWMLADNFRYLKPVTPINILPANDSIDIQLTPTLGASAFNPGDASGTHFSSEWQVTKLAGNYSGANLVDDAISTTALVSYTLPESLQTNKTYWWRVRYRNSYMAWSDYSVETSFTTILNNNPPDKPSNLKPVDGSPKVVTLPELASSAFSDQDPGDTHVASRWQISKNPGAEFAANLLYDSGEVLNLTSYTLPETLPSSTTCYWRVRHKDNRGAWSEYSSETSFSTETIVAATIARWHLDEGTGSSAYDASGNGYNGTLVNNPLWTTNGHSSNALDFDGSGAYVQQSYAPTYAAGDSFGYEMWFNTSSGASGSLMAALAANGAGLEININDGANANKITCRITDNAGANTVEVSSAAGVNDGNWHYLMLVKDEAAKSLILYLDGDTFSTGYAVIGEIDLSACAPAIGARNIQTGYNNYFAGTLDEITVYSDARSAVWAQEASAATPVPPYTTNHTPAPGATGVKPYTTISVDIKDLGVGVSLGSIRMNVDGVQVALDTSAITSGYRITYTPPAYFSLGQTVAVALNASDVQDHVMPQEKYTFTVLSGDTTVPYMSAPSPLGGNAQTLPTISLHVKDDESGVAEDSLSLEVNSTLVYSGANPANYPLTTLTGVPGDYTLTYTPAVAFNAGTAVPVVVGASDLAGNPFSDSFIFTVSDAPEQPVNSKPVAGAAKVFRRPTLAASAFSDTGDTHAASHWRIRTESGNYDAPVYQATTTAELTSHFITSVLDSERKYYWKVKYQDDRGAWSLDSVETSFTTELLWSNTAAMWHLDENTGTAAYDAAPNRYDGAINGTVWTAGKVNSALNFNGITSDYVSVPKGALNNLTDLSIVFWVRTPQFDANTGIISGANASQANELLLFNPDSLTVYLKGSSWNSGVKFNNGNWHHVAVIRNAANNEVSIYMDGALQNSTTTLPAGAISIDAGGLFIGQNQSSVGNLQQSFKGSLDEIAVFNTALSADQVVELHRGLDMPYTSGHVPVKGASGVSPNTKVTVHVKDDGAGINQASLMLQVGGGTVYDGSNADPASAFPNTTLTGDKQDYVLTYTPPSTFAFGSVINVVVDAADSAGNVMPQDSYSFTILAAGSDTQPPYLDNQVPAPNADMVANSADITFHVKDAGVGVDLSTLVVTINGSNVVYNGTDPSAYPNTTVTGDIMDYAVVYNPPTDFSGGEVNVRVDVKDLPPFINSTWVSYKFDINRAPQQPVNQTPVDGANDVPLKPTLKASDFINEAGDFHKKSQWQISTAYQGSPFYDSGAVTDLTSHTLSPLEGGIRYYWRVRYQDSLNVWSEYSEDTSFTRAANNAPDTPGNLSPIDGASAQALSPTLVSSAFSDSDGDTHKSTQWQISTALDNLLTPAVDEFKDNMVFSTTTTGGNLTSYTVPNPLDFDTIYYWRNRHQDNWDAWSNYSAESSFTTVTKTPASGAINYWGLDHIGADNVAMDTVGTKDGTITGATWSSGKSGNGLTFVPGDEVRVPSYNLGTTTAFTVEAWVKRDLINQSQVITSQWTGSWGSQANDVFKLAIAGADAYCSGQYPANAVQFFVASGDTPYIRAATASGVILDNNWHHVVGVYEANSRMDLYLDGQKVNGVLQRTGCVNMPVPSSINNITKDLVIGGGDEQLDEIAIYNRALSCQEILDRYHLLGGTGGACP